MTCDKQFADRLVAGGGWLPECPDHDAPDNPRAVRIVEYIDMGGKPAYGVTFEGDFPDKYMRETDFIGAPHIYWEAPA